MSRQQQRKIEEKLRETEGAGVEAQAEAVAAAIEGPPKEALGAIWKILIGGLLGLLAISLVGLIVLIAADEETSAIATAFTALLTGLLGLFATSPTKSAEEE